MRKSIFQYIPVIFLILIFRIGLTPVHAANSIPVPVITGPDTVEVNTSYLFDGSSSYDPDGAIVRYDWYACDTVPLTSTNSGDHFTWLVPGIKTIYLKVTDDLGASKMIYKTLAVTDSKPPMTGICHVLEPSAIEEGMTASLTVINHPAGSSISFTDEGGGGEVAISRIFDTARINALKSGGKRIGYTVTHPEYAVYRGYVEFMIESGILQTMQGVRWYSPATGFEPGREIDVYIIGAPAGSDYTYVNYTPATASLSGSTGNRLRITLEKPGDADIGFTVSCPGYRDYCGRIGFRIAEEERPAAVITSVSEGYTGETYLFSAADSPGAYDAYEWKWHSPANTVTASSDIAFAKRWTANQYGKYTLYLRTGRDGVWSDWTGKTVNIRQGISFDPDGIYSGSHAITEDEWQYVRGKIGMGYEKQYAVNGRTYQLNIEIYQDKGLIVYGDFRLDGNTQNTFSQGSEGSPYFLMNGAAGEYKFLGYVYGTTTPFSNQNYRAANRLVLQGTERNARLIQYTELPENVIADWGLKDSSNTWLSALLSEINGSDCHGLCNNNASNWPRPLVMKDVFDMEGLGFDPFGFGIINCFDKFNGASVRLFFRYFDGGYDWRTFEGKIDSEKQCPDILLSDALMKEHIVGSPQGTLKLSGSISLCVNDNKQDNMLNNKTAYYYDRNDSHSRALEIKSIDPVISVSTVDAPGGAEYHENNFIYKKDVVIDIDCSLLHEGLNEFDFIISGGVIFSQNAAKSQSYLLKITVRCGSGSIPLVQTLGATEVTAASAVLHYRIHDAGQPEAEEAGIILRLGDSETEYPEALTSAGDKAVSVQGLSPNTLYGYRAYISQGGLIFYGEEKTFVTSRLNREPPGRPTVTDITAGSARITSDHGSYIFCNNEVKPSGSFFYGLNEDSVYQTYAFFEEDTVYERSANSDIASFRTLRPPYSLPDRFLYVGEVISIDGCDSVAVVNGGEYASADGKALTGLSEGTASVTAYKGERNCVFSAHVFDRPAEKTEANVLTDLRIVKIYDPDFVDTQVIRYQGMPVYEHIDSGMIDLGYLVVCEAVFSGKDMPGMPKVLFIGPDASIYLPYVIKNGVFTLYDARILNVGYDSGMMRFDLHIPPQVRFFDADERVRPDSVQIVKEVLVCLDFGIEADIGEHEPDPSVITRSMQDEVTEIFWYNLRKNCYDDLGYGYKR